LCCSTNARITDNTDGKASCQTGQTDREAGAKLDETCKQWEPLCQVVGDEDGDDETVDTNDTGHDDGNDVLDDKVGSQDAHSRDTNAGLCSSICSTKACEDDGGGAAHGTEEGRIDRTEI